MDRGRAGAGRPAGPGVSPGEADGEAVYLQMRDGAASERGEAAAAASHRSDPLFKSALPVPNHSSLYLASIFLPPPSISASNSCPVFVQIFLSLTAAHSLLLLLLPVTLSFTISSISIHLLLLSLCSFSRGCHGKKWVLTVPLLFLLRFPFLFFFLSFFFFHHCVLQQYMFLLGGDVKSSRNAPCKGKKKVMIQSVLLCRKDFFRLVVIHPVCRLYERIAIHMHFSPLSFPFSFSFHCSK